MKYSAFIFIVVVNSFVIVNPVSGVLNKDGAEFDFIVVGGGIGGCVVAGRLAESGDHSVLLIEEGDVPNENLEIPGLARFDTLLQNYPNEMKLYQTTPQENAGLLTNGTIPYMIGKTLGGGSSVNGMFWNRGHPQDYNNWARLTNDESWSYQNMLKYFKRSENYLGFNPTDQRGYAGPITIRNPTFYAPVMDNFIEAAQEIGYPYADPNGPQMPSVAKVDLSQERNGRRASAYSGYLKPLLLKGATKKNSGGTSNLMILLNTEVKRIIFEGRKAIGVKLENSGKVGFARARKEIILSAGVMDSPAILQRSGIGPEEVLNNAGIPVVKALPVGRNLQDHPIVQLPIIFGNRSVLLEPSELNLEAFKEFKEKGEGAYSSILGMKAQGYFKSSLRTSQDNWPDIQVVPLGYKMNAPPEVNDLKEWETNTGWVVNVIRPKSRGSLKLNAEYSEEPPMIDFQYFSHPDDLEVLKDGIKIAARLCEETNTMKGIGCRLSLTPLPACGHFKFRSDSYWTCYIKQKSSTGLHAAGTCRMGGLEDPKAVVDSQLKVIGVDGLRVADASVMPQVTNSNIQAAVYVIAEKAADMILQEWNKNLHNFSLYNFNVN